MLSQFVPAHKSAHLGFRLKSWLCKHRCEWPVHLLRSLSPPKGGQEDYYTGDRWQMSGKKKAKPSEVVPGAACQWPRDPKCYTLHSSLASCFWFISLTLHFFMSPRPQSHIFRNFQHSQYTHAAFPMKSYRWVYGAGICPPRWAQASTSCLPHQEAAQAHRWLHHPAQVRQAHWTNWTSWPVPSWPFKLVKTSYLPSFHGMCCVCVWSKVSWINSIRSL